MSNDASSPVQPGLAEAPAICLVCAGERSRLLYRLGEFDVHRCESCQQVFLFPLPSEERISRLFAGLYGGAGSDTIPELDDYLAACFDASPDSPVIRMSRGWLQRIARHASGGRLLDIGCGTGLFCHCARDFGWQPQGIEAAEEAVEHARREFGLDVRRGDFESLDIEHETFDLVTLWDVLEHSRAPRRLIGSAMSLVRPGGLLALSTPNQRNILEAIAGPLYRWTGGRVRAPLHRLYVEAHFLYFTPDTLRRILSDAGLEVVEMSRERTDLRRLKLSPWMRVALHVLLAASRPLGLENRLFALARKPAAPAGGGA